MRNKTINDLAINAVVAAMYVVLTLVNPIGHGVIQVRISEALCILPFIDRKYTKGIILGVAIANAFSPLGPIDVLFGLLVAVISYSLALIIDNLWLNVLQYSLLSGIIIGIQLNLVLNLPFVFSFFSITTSTLLITAIGAMFMSKIVYRVDQRRR